MSKYFLSHKFDQKELAGRIMGALSEAGAEYQPFSRDISFEPANREIISDAISWASYCLILAEPSETTSSPWLAYIIGVADAWQKQTLIVSASDAWQWPDTLVSGLVRIVQFPRNASAPAQAQRRRVNDVLKAVEVA